MKKLLIIILFLTASLGMTNMIHAQTSQSKASQQELTKAKKDVGSEGAITMDEYEVLHKEFQKSNPGKTFQDLSKEEFETYLTTELAELRKRKAQEALKPKEEGVPADKESNAPY